MGSESADFSKDFFPRQLLNLNIILIILVIRNAMIIRIKTNLWATGLRLILKVPLFVSSAFSSSSLEGLPFATVKIKKVKSQMMIRAAYKIALQILKMAIIIMSPIVIFLIMVI